MSFSYKTLNSNDISLTSYIANKQWGVNNTTLSQNGVTIYIGENLPIDIINPFDPINDSQTSNEEYRRLVYDSIKNLYYQNYTSGSFTGQFFHSSSFFNYEQSTLTSGSMLAAHRNIPTITGSSAIGRNPTLFNNALYELSSSLYDETGFDPDIGSKIVVISIDQNIFGSGLSPKSILISGSTYNIQDDGEGNLFDTLATSSLYVGNVFYSQGLIVITDQDYLCIFGAPPTTANDYYLYQNTEYASQSLQILTNDFADCGTLDPTSVQLMSVPGFSFPNYTINNGVITITPDQTSVIPGNYKLEYTVGNFTGIRSNTSSIDLTITSLPLEINNIISSSVCFNSTASVPVTFSINYGVPPYSYSLDNGTTYTGIPGFFNKTTSGSITASNNAIIYVKDYLDTIVTQSFNSWYPPISYTTSITKLPCSSTSSDGRVTVSNDGTNTATSASIDGGSYFTLPKEFTGLSTGSHTINVKDSFNCITSSIVNLGVYPALTASITQSNVSCYGGSNGSLSIAFTNIIDTLLVTLTDPTGSYIYEGEPLNTFRRNTVTVPGLTTGSYTLSLAPDPAKPLQCQTYNNTFTITSPTALSISTTASYIDSCSNAVIISGSRGTPPYTYFAVNTGSGVTYSSDSSSVSLDGLNSGTYTTFIVDSNNCSSPTSSIEIFGRNYIYTGSFCILSASVNSGYVSSSGIQQTFNSGPYSGSRVTSSYSNGTTLFGPTVNFTQLFTSGTNDFITPCIYKKAPGFFRYYQNTTQCPPPAFCIPPTLLTANPVNCADQENWTSSYTVTYNSGSSSATRTIIQYSLLGNFTDSNAFRTKIITNPSSGSLTVDAVADFGAYTAPTDFVYFRAYNSCSSGITSSFSDIISASCPVPPAPEFNPFTIEFTNKTGNSVQYFLDYGDGITVANNATRIFTASEPGFNLDFDLLGTDRIIGNAIDKYNNLVYTMRVSGSTALLGSGIVTTVIPQINQGPLPTGYPGGIIREYTPEQIIYFSADGSTGPDVSVYTDRTSYSPSATIKLAIHPSDINPVPPDPER
jgi:hypothetical protein